MNESRESMSGVNPDRVRHDVETTLSQETIKHPDVQRVYRDRVQGPSQYSLDINPASRAVESALRATALAALGIGVATNFGIETQSGSSNENLTNSIRVAEALNTIPAETLARNVQEEVCRLIDVDFMERFSTKDDLGNEQFNPGAFVIPFAVSVQESCKAKVDVEIHIPYHFARTFKEIVTKDPKARALLVQKLADFIKKEAEDQITIRGIAGVTDTAMVWNKKTNELVLGKPKVNFGKFVIDPVSFEGVASGEAVRSVSNSKVDSLQGFNPENVRLAERRLLEVRPILIEAMKKAGVDPKVLQNAKSFSYEHNLVDSEINALAEIARKVFGYTIRGTNADMAYTLVHEYNAKNPSVVNAFKANPEDEKRFAKFIDASRGVNLSFSSEVEFKKEGTYNIPIPFPLLLLMLGAVRVRRTPGELKNVEYIVSTPVPDTITQTVETRYRPIARRLFSEVTPKDINESRDFNAVYDSINLSSRPEDTQLLLEHLLIEEVLPSLTNETREPLIDYGQIINGGREYLGSDTRRFEEKKGSYGTVEEAQRKITEELLSMWEKHDAFTYQMPGIDTETVLNYRHSDHIVYWAKTLAYAFVRLMQETHTTEEMRNALLEQIDQVSRSGDSQGGSNRNLFVQSIVP